MKKSDTKGKGNAPPKKTPKTSAGHRQRLRERFLKSGLSGFHDYEVIELLLTLGTPRRDCKQSAKDAVKEFKNFPGVIEASTEELCKIKGIGPKNLIGLRLIKAVADRYLQLRLIDKDPIRNTNDLFDYLFHNLKDRSRESFSVVYLDAKNKVITSETLFQGTLTASSVYPREVVRSAIAKNAASLIFCHNHTSGDPEPSAADHAITRQLIFSCQMIGISVHDHIVIGENYNYYSFAKNRLIEKYTDEFSKITIAKSVNEDAARTNIIDNAKVNIEDKKSKTKQSNKKVGQDMNEKPECFGNLETVFPMKDDGLRMSPESCMQCPDKTECLRTAIVGPDGNGLKEERLDRAYDAGNVGFFERWSRKKKLNRK